MATILKGTKVNPSHYPPYLVIDSWAHNLTRSDFKDTYCKSTLVAQEAPSPFLVNLIISSYLETFAKAFGGNLQD